MIKNQPWLHGVVTALDIGTGRILWRDRTFARAQLPHADGKLIILDEERAARARDCFG